MLSRAADWFKQAERDLGQAEDSRCTRRHEWACFAAHQAAEKAVKALHLHMGYTEDEWRRLDPASRFGRMLAREIVWVWLRES